MEEACWKGYKQVGMKKKGDRMVPDCVPEDTTTASIPNPAATAQGPKLKATLMHDRRRSLKKKPKLLKKFRKYLEDMGVQ